MKPSEELRYSILALQREGNRGLIAALKPLGVTPAQAEVIRVLDEFGSLTLAGLGELLICESGTGPSRLVDRLVTANAIHRTVNPADRRSIRLELTPEGRRLSAQIALVENSLYQSIDDAVAGAQLETVLAVARHLLSGSEAGAALNRRKHPSK